MLHIWVHKGEWIMQPFQFDNINFNNNCGETLKIMNSVYFLNT